MTIDRHRRLCKVCKHPELAEIEEDYINWLDVATICKKYGVARDNVYRHVRAFNLDKKRDENYKGYLTRIQERSLKASKTNASDGINAAKLKAQIDGKLVEKREVTNKADEELKELLDKLGNLDLRQLKALSKISEDKDS